MTPETILDIGSSAIQLTILLSSVLLIPALIVGLMVSVFQAATQVNEMTLTFVPKLFVIFGLLVVLGPWILFQITNFTRNLILEIPSLIG
ncbi:flagellar biosynthesis protein FliQ [Gammaproteobacteria bacterium AH-315-C21]|jgi:flagellar biosynthetic protein FliQ|nr:flagellar biosynthesis protein FliQ [Gammaproteobacteria bacterium]MBN4078448.1 flagellar biosynthesis protein FliQ [Gammaproteobacteria bacterium AH-315-C21]PCH62710.1 MAG: flagellar biosynthetic protein FliQ [Gammaproteobacteria bacterium]PCH64155.1 MAG: flagellar biosynthetic protein FliQ [Gammaproteobacteria bacterium]